MDPSRNADVQVWHGAGRREAPAAAPSRSSRPLAVEGLLFDMGDVLYDATLWRRWLLQLLARHGVHAHYRSLFTIWEIDFLEEVHRGHREYHEAFHAFLRSMGLSAGLVDEIEAASVARKRELEATTRPLPGVRSTLARLREMRLKLGVLSDSESAALALRAKLETLGLRQGFDAVLSSRDLGEIKPHPCGYRASLAALELPAARVAFVGHDAEELRGAAALGMPTIAFNYQGKVEADVHLERFDELLSVCLAAQPRQSWSTAA
jgi:HAD superfamily hydrolase (TIGR01509 family)